MSSGLMEVEKTKLTRADGPGRSAYHGFSCHLDRLASVACLLSLVGALYELWTLELDASSQWLLRVTALTSAALLTWSRGSGRRGNRRALTPIPLLFLFGAAWVNFYLCHHGPPADPQLLVADAFPPDDDIGQNVIPNIVDPLAVDPQSVCPGYVASNVAETEVGMTADLVLAGDACNVYGTDVEALTLTVEYQAEDRLHVGIQPKYLGKENRTWFILPEELVPKPSVERRHLVEGQSHQAQAGIHYSWSNEPTFWFKVIRKSTGDVLFTTQGSQLVYEDQFIEFVSWLPQQYNLYGLGESISGFRLGDNVTRTLYAADVGDVIDANIYGHQPIYYDTRYYQVDPLGKTTHAPNATDKDKEYRSYTHGVFHRNAHGQEVLLRKSNITWRALGGSIDLYFLAGPSTEEVVRSYQKSAIGFPALQPFWALGFHQCRWGYDNWTQVQSVVEGFKESGIPLEAIWTDIDYMNKYRNFENDAVRFGYKEARLFIDGLHANNQHYIPIVDSAIYAPEAVEAGEVYAPYDRGVQQDAFMLNADGSLYVGSVWPGYTVFPDWVGAALNGTGANRWWSGELSAWHEQIKFDGIWIDMRQEAGAMREMEDVGTWTGSMPSSPEPGTTSDVVDDYFRTRPTPGARNINWPPYTINNYRGDLAAHAVSPNATHHGGTVEYDFHSLFGHQILNATYHALLNIFPGKRPFIIGRSQFAGSGKWAGHWGGDNYSWWSYLYLSIPQALSYSLFGIPMFGVDTCGFAGDTDAELCSRWMQLSAFFPFYRNHNEINGRPQEPYLWPEVAAASRSAMRIRYALLPYLYTAMYASHATGSTVMRALAWEFPDEPWLAGADRQFLLGPAIMVVPCMEKGASIVHAVFPGVGRTGAATVWYDWHTLMAVHDVGRGQNVTISAPLGHIPLYIRGGHIVPLQEPELTTAGVRNSVWSLLVALDANDEASGGLYLDDGESVEELEKTWVDLQATATRLEANPSGNYLDTNALASVSISGIHDRPVSSMQFNGQEVLDAVWTLDRSRQVLTITGLEEVTRGGAWKTGWTLEWS